MTRALRSISAISTDRDFSRLLTAQFAVQAADGCVQAAFADKLLLEPLGQAPERILGLFVLTLLPYSLISPFLGVFVDHWRRRSVLIWANLGRAAILLITAVVIDSVGGPQPLYLSALVLLGMGRLWLSTKGAVLPVLLHERHLLRGNAISGGGGMVSALLGGVAGLAIVETMTVNTALLIAGLVYCVSAFVANRISDPMAHPHAHLPSVIQQVKRVTSELADGMRAVWTRVRVRLPLLGIFLLRTVAMLVTVAAILIIKQEFPGSEDRSGRLTSSALAVGSAGIGAFVGVLTAPFVGRRLNKPGLVLLGFGVSGTGLIALGGMGSVTAVLGLTFVGGYGAFVAKVAVDAQVQEELPDEYRGRAFALYDIIYNLASVAAALVMVAVGGTSVGVTLVVAGIATLGLALLLGVAMRNAQMTFRPQPG